MTTTKSWWSEENLKQRLSMLNGRGAAVRCLRKFFQDEGFVEVDTPALQISPGMDRHIRPFSTQLTEPFASESQQRYLRTSPEFAMKKLLAGGQNASLSKIMQLCRVWRDGERSPLHHPEFTMLEWYRSDADYGSLIADCERVLQAVSNGVAQALKSDGMLHWQGNTCDPNKPIQRVTVKDMFVRHAQIDLFETIDDFSVPNPSPEKLKSEAQSRGLHVGENDSWEDIFFRIMIERIEPKLGMGAATVLCEYPSNLASLARRTSDDGRFAERFELYACGVELANAYSELTDPAEQRIRFEHDRTLHEKLYGNAPPIDEELLCALSFLPPCAGAALGFDRLVMLATGAKDITEVIWSPVP
ncbi:MAG TPA: EF-P lysine aminoacylase GenX [Rhodospirillaceae bacterium]|nr:EF-P lysine aminoacylase GenX [Candidatus Neomarinimicrobiota bacterium]HCX13972.1 EF-P lysine aminoacylase GenX [Rhodospirillaceae bacterium]